MRDEKGMNPMFPRLHVNDTETKGGPRAPPRNKMALYEQFSVPSQRNISGSSSIWPLPPIGKTSSVSSISSIQGNGQKRDMFTAFCSSSTPHRLAENLHSSSHGGLHLSTVTASGEALQAKPTTYVSLNNKRQLPPTGNIFRPYNFSNFKNFSSKKLRNVDDLYVPTISKTADAGLCSKLDLNSTVQLETGSSAKEIKDTTTAVAVSLARDKASTDAPKEGLDSLKEKYVQYVEACAEKDTWECDSNVRNDSCLKESLGKDETRNMNRSETAHGFGRDKTNNASKSSVDKISPDDIVEVLGEKRYWQARSDIMNQQRIFSLQVFELHKLIKVQKLIAESSHLLFEEKLLSPVKMSPPDAKQKDHTQKLISATEYTDENLKRKLPLPSSSKEVVNQQPNIGYTVPNPVATTNIKPLPFCLPAAGNQWLVPVMSPSEGLIYKPYTPPFPSVPGFTIPTPGNCIPSDDFVKRASHPQGMGIINGIPPVNQPYFPPYGMQVMNPYMAGAGVEQMNPFGPYSTVDVNFLAPNQNSCNISSRISQVTAFPPLKESEIQGSTASSPPEGFKRDVLPLFPTEPTLRQNDLSSEQRSNRVVKVVPHNPRSASESAARIFQYIQDERRLRDHD